MANLRAVLTKPKISENYSRIAFDRSFSVNTSYQLGGLEPIFAEPVIAGSHIKLNRSIFQRTAPVNTAAFPKIEHRRRLSVKPGLTCYWQIEDRSDNGDFDNMINKDLRYIDEWSLWLDIKLFFRTIPAVLFGKGAK